MAKRSKIKRSHMKRWASDNIQVKGSTRAKANMPQRRFFTGTIKHEDPWLATKFPAKVIPEVELLLRGIGDNPVPRGAVLQRLKKFHEDTDPSRFVWIKEQGKIKAKLFFSSDGKRTRYWVQEEDGIAKVLRKSLSSPYKDKVLAQYNNRTIIWKEVLTLSQLQALASAS